MSEEGIRLVVWCNGATETTSRANYVQVSVEHTNRSISKLCVRWRLREWYVRATGSGSKSVVL